MGYKIEVMKVSRQPNCSFTSEDYVLLERACLAIGRLDALVSASSLAEPWRLRASWTGYARAVQLHGAEIDEIDVFSWGSGIAPPNRTKRNTLVDDFGGFPVWREQLAAKGRHWTDGLPFSPVASDPRQPMLLRALSLQAQWLEADQSTRGWLALPVLIWRLGVTQASLPCLVAGDRQLVYAPRDTGPSTRRILRELEENAIAGRKALIAIEDSYAIAASVIAAERRPSALRPLIALMSVAPVQTPQAVANRLRLTVSGAGKLLSRAADLGLMLEVSGRRSWRIYVVPDVAVALGLAPTPKGRPRKRPPAPIAPAEPVASLLEAFDREMEAFDLLVSKTESSRHHGAEGTRR